MNDALEVRSGRRVFEDEPAERSAIEGAARVEDALAEPCSNGLEAGRPGRDGLAGENIGVDDPGPEVGEHARHGRLARADAAGEAEDLHRAEGSSSTPPLGELEGEGAARLAPVSGARLDSRPSRGHLRGMTGLRAVASWSLSILSVAAFSAGSRVARAAEPIGAARCGTCHIDAYRSWLDSPHARSLEGLTDVQRADPTCRACHTLAPESEDPALQGVQCESCHGLGSDYAPEHVMRDPHMARLFGLLEVTTDTCRACHEGVDARLRPYDYRAMLKEVAHGQLPAATAPPPAPGGRR